jgi:hypothetical protein
MQDLMLAEKNKTVKNLGLEQLFSAGKNQSAAEVQFSSSGLNAIS